LGKHYTLNVFHREIVTINELGQTTNGFKNHDNELNYGNLILQDRKIFGNYFIQIYYSQIFNENMDK
jgi:hypothetical protein